MARSSRIRVAVTGDEFQVDDARLPLPVIADVVALDAAGKREALGVGAHPLAFVVQRPWIGGAVQVLLDDPADPTPFWVVSTRHPVELATALLERRGEQALSSRRAPELSSPERLRGCRSLRMLLAQAAGGPAVQVTRPRRRR